jgi:predicted Zn-dependent protease
MDPRQTSRLLSVSGLAAVLVLAGLPHAACGGASGPPSAKRRVVLATAYDDEAVGRESSEEVRAELGLVEDPELTAFVSQVGRRLALYAPGFRFDYTFRIVDQDTPNAFALPGGYVYVSRGLLALSDSEDELANVLGHEIMHVARRHASARQLVGPSNPLLFNWLRIRSLAAYSRNQEHEADRLGQGLAALAGYDPEGLATFLKSLEFTVRLELGHTRFPSYFDTHPGTVERGAGAAARASKITWALTGARKAGISANRPDYLQRLEGLAVGTSASEGVFQGQRFLHPDLGFTLRFPDRWETRNTRRAVGAVSSDRSAQVFLEHQGEGDDPEKAAHEYLAKAAGEGLRPERKHPLKLGGSLAYRVFGGAITPQGPARIVLTWIAHQGSIYRIAGVAGPGRWSRYEGVFQSVARSFRPLTPELRASIHETRLRIVAAQPGESLRALSERTGNQWDLQRTALMNDMFATERPSPGQPMKVAVREEYHPKAE